MSTKKKHPSAPSSRQASATGRRSSASISSRAAAAQDDQGTPRRSWARILWGAVAALCIGALLFEFTMLWTLGVGVYMVALQEFSGLWLIVAGYALACTPPAFGLLIATGDFWRSLTHALWIGALYALAGYLLLDTALGAF